MNLNVKFDRNSMAINADFGEVYRVTEYVGGKPYEGSYEIVPTAECQTLATKDRVLTNDIKILGIPQEYGLVTYNQDRTITIT